MNRDSNEKCLLTASEIVKHFDHPIDHFGSQSRCNLVCCKTALYIKLSFFFIFSKVLIHRRGEFGADIDILSFYFWCCFSRNMQTWMLINVWLWSLMLAILLFKERMINSSLNSDSLGRLQLEHLAKQINSVWIIQLTKPNKFLISIYSPLRKTCFQIW